MCGRYVTVSTVQTIESRFQVQAAPDVSNQWRPNANVSHGEAAPVIRDNKDIIFDEFEYDQSSIRRIVGIDVCHATCIMCVHHIFMIGV